MTPFRPDRADHLDVLARKAARWAKDHADRIAERDPEMPDGIINREADNWRPLLAIAEEAGGEWSDRARMAAEAAHIAAAGDDASRLEVLLGDIRGIFTEQGKDEIPSADLVRSLVGLEGRPWGELGRSRKPLTQNRLARMLKPISVTPEPIEVEDDANLGKRKQARGYKRERFEEAFTRYLPLGGDSNCHSVTDPIKTGTSGIFKPSRAEDDVTVVRCEKPNNDGLCSGVTVAKGDSHEEEHTVPQNDDQPPPPKGSSPSGEPYAQPPSAARSNGQAERVLYSAASGEPCYERDLRGLLPTYQDRVHALMKARGSTDLDLSECDAWLRQRLAAMGVPPERIEYEFERLMVEVFRTHSH